MNKWCSNGLACLRFSLWTCSGGGQMPGCSRVDHWGHTPAPQLPVGRCSPIAEQLAALFGRCCRTEGTLGRSAGAHFILQAACLNQLLHWQTSLLGTSLCHPPQASCLPNRWAQTSVPETSMHIGLELPIQDLSLLRSVTPSKQWTPTAGLCEMLQRNYPHILIWETINSRGPDLEEGVRVRKRWKETFCLPLTGGILRVRESRSFQVECRFKTCFRQQRNPWAIF